jgi:hypothetical protein
MVIPHHWYDSDTHATCYKHYEVAVCLSMHADESCIGGLLPGLELGTPETALHKVLHNRALNRIARVAASLPQKVSVQLSTLPISHLQCFCLPVAQSLHVLTTVVNMCLSSSVVLHADMLKLHQLNVG